MCGLNSETLAIKQKLERRLIKIRTERIGIIVAAICIIMLNVLVWCTVVETVRLEQNNEADVVTETTTCVTTTTEEETTTLSATTTSSTETITSATSYTAKTQTETTTLETTTETARQTMTVEETTSAYTTPTTHEVTETKTTEQTAAQSQMTYLGQFTGMYYKGSTYPCNGGSGRMLVSCYEKTDSYKGSVASKFVYYNYDYNVNGKTMVYIEFEKYPQLNGWYSVDDCNEDQKIVDFYFADYSTCPWKTDGITTINVWICV